MGIIKDLLLRLEKLENDYKILQGKFNKLKVRVDVENDKINPLPDAFTYTPQQPYVGGVEGLDFIKIRESEDIPKTDGIHNDIEVEVVTEENEKILKFSRPPYAIYFPDVEEE